MITLERRWKRRYDIKLNEFGLVLTDTIRAVVLARRNEGLREDYDSKYIISVIEKMKERCVVDGDALKISARTLFGNDVSVDMVNLFDNSPGTRMMSIEKSTAEIDDILETATKLNPDDFTAIPDGKLVFLEYFCKMMLELVYDEKGKLDHLVASL